MRSSLDQLSPTGLLLVTQISLPQCLSTPRPLHSGGMSITALLILQAVHIQGVPYPQLGQNSFRTAQATGLFTTTVLCFCAPHLPRSQQISGMCSGMETTLTPSTSHTSLITIIRMGSGT